MTPRRRFWVLGAIVVAVAAAGGGIAFFGSSGARETRESPSSNAVIVGFCAACHRFPPPATLPRGRWRDRIAAMFEIVRTDPARRLEGLPSLEACVAYYESRAPEALPAIASTAEKGPGRLRLERSTYRVENLDPFPGVSHISLVHLFDDRNPEILVSEMRYGMVFVIQPAFPERRKRLLTRQTAQFHPCHAEVADLDRDGRRDVLVANLGTVTPSDVTQGSVLWLQQRTDGSFNAVTLAERLGRVADVQAADFDGDGDLDLAVAVFGWRRVGNILLLENETQDWSAPSFTPIVVDPRPGAIHVPVTDLDRDGRPDFVALISQQFEAVVAFLNRGAGSFEARELYAAEHPNWGSTGIQLVDLDCDGDTDVLFSNGDSLDDLTIKPYHGLQWLENRGGFPFTAHRLTDLYGASAAKAADLDGDGDLDIAASVFLPFIRPDNPNARRMESVVWLEQTAPGTFERHSLGVTDCHYPTLELGDLDRDGDADILLGTMSMAKKGDEPIPEWVVVMKNLGR
jgi:hypothetical protein